MFMTLDGFIAGPKGELDWIFKESDEYRLLVFPVVLGNGIPLFKNMKERVGLKLVKSRTFKSGIVELFYVRGAVK